MRLALVQPDIVSAIEAAQSRIVLKKRGRARWYEIEIDGEWIKVPGVTSPLGMLAKPALVSWAARLQVDADVMTAWEIYESGKKFKDAAEFDGHFRSAAPAKRAHVEALEKAISIGDDVHSLIENNLKERMGLPVEAVDASDDARFVYAGFSEWADSVDLKPLMVEARLASFKHRYAGTMDNLALVRLDGDLTILDWKTSKGVYPEMRLQNVAYRKAFQEMTGVLPNGMLVRLPKDRGEIEPVPMNHPEKDNVEELFKVFLSLLEIYPWAKEHGPLANRYKKPSETALEAS